MKVQQWFPGCLDAVMEAAQMELTSFRVVTKRSRGRAGTQTLVEMSVEDAKTLLWYLQHLKRTGLGDATRRALKWSVLKFERVTVSAIAANARSPSP